MPPAPPTAETVAPHSGPGPGPGRWRGRRSLGPSPAAPLTGISGASCPRRVGISPRPGPLEQTPRGDPAGPRKRVATDPRVGRGARLPHPERRAGAGRAPPGLWRATGPPPLYLVLNSVMVTQRQTGQTDKGPPERRPFRYPPAACAGPRAARPTPAGRAALSGRVRRCLPRRAGGFAPRRGMGALQPSFTRQVETPLLPSSLLRCLNLA